MAMYNEITVTAELTNTEYMITKNYNLLQNKPQINSVELIGNKSLEDLGINPDAEENVIDVVKVNGSALTPDADKAVNVTVTTGSDNGTVKVNGSDVAVKGLKSAAFTEATAYDAAGSAAEVQGNVDALTVVVNGKVDKVQGKGLSQNDFTNAYKTKLDGIEPGAQVNTVTSVAGKTGAVNLSKSDVGLGNVDNTSDLNKPISTATQTALNGKVDKEAGKGLSTNDYTTADKTKLAGIEAEANKTIVDSVISGISINPVQNKVIYDLINNLLPEATASGNPISIDNASGFNAKSAKVTMLPIQSGSGDPSPENIRPISGRDSVDLNCYGKNFFRTTATSGSAGGVVYSVNSDGTIDVSGTATGSTSFVIGDALVNSNMGTAVISGIETATNIAWNSIQLLDENDIVLSTISGGSTYPYFSIDLSQYPTAYKIVCTTKRNNNGVVSGTIKPQVELGSQPTIFEPYIPPTTYTATFPSTVYGGEYEFVEGGLTDKYAIINNMGSISWTYNSSFNVFICYPSGKANGITNLICDRYKVFNGGFANMTDKSICGNSANGTVYVKDTDYTNADDFKSAVSGGQIAYELATPTETTLTPQSIALNKGNNVITTDGDNAELKYSVLLDSLVSN